MANLLEVGVVGVLSDKVEGFPTFRDAGDIIETAFVFLEEGVDDAVEFALDVTSFDPTTESIC